MSRKIRTPKGQIAALPSPSWTFELLAGQHPHCRLPGWVEMFSQHLGAPDARQVWELHQEALLEEAGTHGFEPFWLHKRRPKGAGFDAWAQAFLHEHRY